MTILDGVDTLSIAPHKFYGLNGSGLLIKKKDLIIEPQIHGGLSTTLYRSGTPALRLALEGQEERARYVEELNVRLRGALAAYPAVRLNSPDSAVPHILNLSVRGVKGTDFQQALARRDVCSWQS